MERKELGKIKSSSQVSNSSEGGVYGQNDFPSAIIKRGIDIFYDFFLTKAIYTILFLNNHIRSLRKERLARSKK